MIETIIQFQQQNYPFDSSENCPTIKVQGLYSASNINQLAQLKSKFQYLKNKPSDSIIQLLQIYQQHLMLHLIYQYVPYSFCTYIKDWINQNQDEQNSADNKKLLMKIFAHELNQLIENLVLLRIYIPLDFDAFGMTEYNFFKTRKLKYYLGNNFIIVNNKKQQLHEHYTKQRRRIFKQMEQRLNFCKRSEYMPNYIIRGNKLIFTDQLSDTTTRKPHRNYPDLDTKSQYGSQHPRKYSVGGRNWGKGKQKRHKKSCNFDRQSFYDGDNYERSFDDKSQISITQTKSIKVQIQHQKANQRRRKNSYKFKITTCEQIQIDQDSPQLYAKARFQTHSNDNRNSQHFQQQREKNPQNNNNKDYKQKVKQAKQKANALLNHYFKTKKKSSFK